MSIRIYLRPNSVPVQAGKVAKTVTVIDDVEVVLSQDGGLHYIHAEMLTPLHPSLRKQVIRATYMGIEAVPEIVAVVKPGFYKHGKFEAEVEARLVGAEQRRDFILRASAPTVHQLKRYVRKIMAGKSAPKQQYGAAPSAKAA